MRVVIFVKANPDTEAGKMPTEEELRQMTEFNEELVKSGKMLAGEGLHPSSKGVRVAFIGSERKVIDGPFAEAKELVAGYWMLQVSSMEEAVELAKRIPFEDGEVEIRPVFEDDDFGDELTPELREREARMREEIEAS